MQVPIIQKQSGLSDTLNMKGYKIDKKEQFLSRTTKGNFLEKELCDLSLEEEVMGGSGHLDSH